ncbi:anhydro-N-acetylmuramic acid kinase [Gammaproteobacteria bacterium 45_16_T64]|nr:anhydro-N-acetylmuramic acid kinase [Gammaproteobacteria bacterium 45_16_T64]
MTPEYYIGLMSGTSLDGIDTALVEFSSHKQFCVLETLFTPYPTDMRNKLFQLFTPGNAEIDLMGQLSRQLGQLFGQSVNNILELSPLSAKDISAVGSHGQTIRHRPELLHPFTLQIGDPSTITQTTGITTIADFRSKDIACGGQGAPLAPGFHRSAFHSPNENRVIVNIGGIANITWVPLSPEDITLGFDTGPGNGLMDTWCQKHIGAEFDRNGEWARSGSVIKELLDTLTSFDYFQTPPPKSTGKELFNEEWLNPFISSYPLAKPADIQATLLELTAISISRSIKEHCTNADNIFVCGGGALNGRLMERIAKHISLPTYTTAKLGVDPLWVEAIAFAWLARQTKHNLAGNLPSSTGAREAVILGGIYPGSEGI